MIIKSKHIKKNIHHMIHIHSYPFTLPLDYLYQCRTTVKHTRSKKELPLSQPFNPYSVVCRGVEICKLLVAPQLSQLLPTIW